MGDGEGVPLTSAVFEPGKLVGVIVALVTTLLPTMLGCGLAENTAVMSTTLGWGFAEEARPWPLDEDQDVKFRNGGDWLTTEDGRGAATVVEDRAVVKIGLRDNEIRVEVKLFGGPTLVTIGTGAADEVVNTVPG